MKLTHLANKQVVISRLTPVAGTSNRLALSTVTGVGGHLQPIASERSGLFEGVTGKAYKLFVGGDIDIQEMDRLTDSDGKVYTVKKGGVTRWRHGAMDYLEVIVVQQ